MNQKKSHVPKVYLILLFLLMPFHLLAQSPSDVDSNLSLSLQEATEIALEQNFAIEQAEYDIDKTRAQYRQTNALFLPQISFDYNAVSTNDPLNVFGFKLKQEIVTQQDFNPCC